jgi:hypothetical protein
MLPDDDEPLPRRRPAIDEVQEAHAASGAYLPPLGPKLAQPATSASGSVMPPSTMGSSLPSSGPANSPMGTPMSAPMGTPMSTPMGTPMSTPMGTPMNSGMLPQPATVIDTSGTSTIGTAMMNQQTMQMNTMAATAQAQASVGIAQTSLDKELLDDQLKKEDEHWVKSYWRPAMGWLYMAICFTDFIGFPALSMFLPVIMKGFGVQMNYTPWTSLSLSNGGLMHLAFGAILGVAAYSRGQEKLAAMK